MIVVVLKVNFKLESGANLSRLSIKIIKDHCFEEDFVLQEFKEIK